MHADFAASILGLTKTPLAADPYAHQPDGAWKTKRQQSDRQLLSQLFGMTEGEVYEGKAIPRSREQVFRIPLRDAVPITSVARASGLAYVTTI